MERLAGGEVHVPDALAGAFEGEVPAALALGERRFGLLAGGDVLELDDEVEGGSGRLVADGRGGDERPDGGAVPPPESPLRPQRLGLAADQAERRLGARHPVVGMGEVENAEGAELRLARAEHGGERTVGGDPVAVGVDEAHADGGAVHDGAKALLARLRCRLLALELLDEQADAERHDQGERGEEVEEGREPRVVQGIGTDEAGKRRDDKSRRRDAGGGERVEQHRHRGERQPDDDEGMLGMDGGEADQAEGEETEAGERGEAAAGEAPPQPLRRGGERHRQDDEGTHGGGGPPPPPGGAVAEAGDRAEGNRADRGTDGRRQDGRGELDVDVGGEARIEAEAAVVELADDEGGDGDLGEARGRQAEGGEERDAGGEADGEGGGSGDREEGPPYPPVGAEEDGEGDGIRRPDPGQRCRQRRQGGAGEGERRIEQSHQDGRSERSRDGACDECRTIGQGVAHRHPFSIANVR